jgi:hypothetical protein
MIRVALLDAFASVEKLFSKFFLLLTTWSANRTARVGAWFSRSDVRLNSAIGSITPIFRMATIHPGE